MAPEPIIPGRPADVSAADWDALLLASDGGHCARLRRGECAAPCLAPDGAYRVDLDHIVPRAVGGTSEVGNLQFLCAAENRWVKSARPDAWYGNSFWFDKRPNLDRLNPAQLQQGWNVVESLADEFVNPRSIIFDRVLTLAWIVGAGKTMGVLAVICAINQIRLRSKPACRRVSRLLWLAPQEALTDQIANELRDETTQLGIWPTAPRVATIKKSSDWRIADLRKVDIVVACPQAIWDRKGRLEADLDRLREYLSRFEACVADEAHWGTERLLTVLKLLPTDAFKFATTATPMDKDGVFFSEWPTEVRDRFVLFSVFDYQAARDHLMVRIIPEWDAGLGTNYIEVSGGAGDEFYLGDIQQTIDSSSRDDIYRNLKMVKQAIDDVIAADNERGFDGHIMLFCENHRHLKLLWQALVHERFNLPRQPGWMPVSCYAGKAGPPANNNPKLSSISHPWMASKKRSYGGRAKDDHASRLLLVVDIGTYGINQRYAVAIIFCASTKSLVELIQRIGRIIRPADKDDRQQIRIYWSRAFDMGGEMAEAIQYLLDMRSALERRGFKDVFELLAEGTPAIHDLPPHTGTLPSTESAKLDDLLGREILAAGGADIETSGSVVDPDAIVQEWRQWRRDLGKPPSEEEDASAAEHVDHMLHDPDYRRRRIGPKTINCRELLLREEPRDDWTIAEIERAIDAGEIPLPKGFTPDQCKEKMRYDAFALEMFRTSKTKREREFYVVPPVVMSMHAFASSTADELYRKLIQHWVVDRKVAIGVLERCVRSALASYFMLPNVKAETIADKEAQLVDAASRNYGSYRIKALAVRILISWHPEYLPRHAACYRGAAASIAVLSGDATDGITENADDLQ